MPVAEAAGRLSLARLIPGGRGWIEWVLLFALALGLAAGLLASRLVDPLDALIYDASVRATARTPDPRILVVAIDEDSLRDVGRWPWPREVHAQLIDRLAAAQPAAIAYDVLFVDPAQGDDALRTSIATAGKVALPLLVEIPGANGAAYRETPPVAPAAVTGHVLVRPDADGVFRRIVPLVSAGGRDWPHLALATARLAGSHTPGEGTLIPFAGPPGSYASVSFGAVLRGEVPPELIHDRIVMVGATAAGLGDRFATPVGGERDLMPGVEVQANIVDALLHDGLRQTAPFGTALAFAGAALAALWTGFLFAGPRENLVIAVLIVVGIVAASLGLLVAGGVWLRPAAALVVVALMFPLWGWRRLAAASRYLDTEIARLGGADGTAPGGDHIARQIALLDAAGARMETLRRQRDETLAFLSHDLRGPAAAIVGLVPANDRVAGHARRLLRLADQFVQGLRAEDAPLAIEPVELAALLDEAADQCWEAAERVRGHVEVACSWDLPELSTDRALMARAVVNLIDNALKYGGEAPVVRVRGWVQGGAAVVTVADNGPGLKPDKAAALFKPYERAGATRPDGVGLGLALVATFARRQEGNVRCVARPGTGALFELRLPLL